MKKESEGNPDWSSAKRPGKKAKSLGDLNVPFYLPKKIREFIWQKSVELNIGPDELVNQILELEVEKMASMDRLRARALHHG